MKRFFLPLVFALSAASFAADTLQVDQVLKDLKKYDKKTISVKGMVDGFDARTSKKGNEYTVFKLKDKAGKTISVYSRGHLKTAPKNADWVVVTGFFQVEKKVGSQTFKNEIDCSPKVGQKNGVVKAAPAIAERKPNKLAPKH